MAPSLVDGTSTPIRSKGKSSSINQTLSDNEKGLSHLKKDSMMDRSIKF